MRDVHDMNLFGLVKCSVVFGLLFILALPVCATTTISGGDNKLQYTGRIDFRHADAPQISWPGTSIAGNFTGQYLSVTLDDQIGKNYFNVFIDNDFNRPIIIQADQGEKKYVVAANLAPGKHSFLFTKRTEGEEGATTIKSFELADGEKLLAPPVSLRSPAMVHTHG